MIDDFVMICKSYPDVPHLNLYPLGDVHIGSKECDVELLRKWVGMVETDENGVVCIVGDLMNMGLRNSKSNVYEETLSPHEQKEACCRLLKPIASKILAGCSGNHEYRNVKEVGTNPLYDVFCRLGIGDCYRENACFLKLNVGKWKGFRPNTYGVVLTHGSTKNKDLSWTHSVDGADIFISGHTHQALHMPQGKIRMDLTHEVVKTVPFQHIVAVPFQQYGGYAIRGKYIPNSLGQFQVIQLAADSKRIGYFYK